MLGTLVPAVVFHQMGLHSSLGLSLRLFLWFLFPVFFLVNSCVCVYVAALGLSRGSWAPQRPG